MKASTMLLAAVLAGLAASSALGASERDGATIQNSGSTNSAGYVIKVWSNGTTSVQSANRAGVTTGTPRQVAVPQSLVQQFLTDVRTAKNQGHGPTVRCMKSASFGTSTIVRYHGWLSSDLECPGDAQLTGDVHSIVEAAQAGGVRRRIPMLPNEPRRPETTPQATATPEYHLPAP